MSDHISELLGDQPILDESQMPDSGTTDADLETSSELEGQQGSQQQTEADAEFGRRKTVPLGALQEERARRQELQEQLRQQAELNQRMQQRFEQMMGHMQQAQQPAQQPPQEPEIPAFVDDPEGHVRALTEKFQREMAALRQHYEGQTQQQQAAVAGQQLAQRVSAAEQEFMTTQADYPQAAEFFAQRKAAEYAAIGADPVSIQNQLARDYQGIAVTAVQQGKNPAQVLYNLAKAMGYSTATQQQQQPAAQGLKTPPKAPTSLSGVAGAGRSPEESNGVTLESIAGMSDAEFDKFWSQMSRGSRQAPRF